jgi:hypothetical protein
MSDDVLELQEAVLDGGIRAVNFFTGRLLSGKDFSREQDARRNGDARLGQALGCGVAYGLEVEESVTKSTPTQPVVKVYAGEAVNACGQTLYLESDAYVALAQQPAEEDSSGVLFKACGAITAGSYVSGAGVYILTIAPAQANEGSAPTNGLDPFNVRCNTDATVEAVQFRLLVVPPTWYAALDKTSSRFRSELAALFFGNDEVDGLLTAMQPPADQDYADSGASLTCYDVPLALVYFADNALQFIDNGAVRRRVTRKAIDGDWALFADDRRGAESEALFLQFQEQLAAVAKPLASAKSVQAADYFACLPPAGVLPIGTNQFDWKAFFGSAAPATTIDLDRGLVRSVLRHSFAQEPVAVDTTPAVAYHVYRIVTGTGAAAPYVVFARSSLAEVIAADVSFDNSVCQLPNADNVQTAIEELWKLTRCGCSIVIAPQPGWEKAFDQIPDGADAEICFQAGDYPLDQPLRITNKGWLRLTGAGVGTRIHADSAETALSFEHCAGVHISDLAVESGGLGSSGSFQHVGGALNFVGCSYVDAEHLTLACASDLSTGTPLSRRAASCMSVSNGSGSSAGEVRVRSCTFVVGRQQVGMQLVNVSRAQIEDNVLRVAPQSGITWDMLDADYQSTLMRRLFTDPKAIVKAQLQKPAKAGVPAGKTASHAKSVPVKHEQAKVRETKAVPAKAAPKPAKKSPARRTGKAAKATQHIAVAKLAAGAAAPSNDIAEVTYGGVSVSFRTAPALAKAAKIDDKTTANAWQQLVDQMKPTGVNTAADLTAVLERSAATIMANGKAPGYHGVAIDKFVPVAGAILNQEVVAAAQGIVVAGQSIDEVRIVNNTLDGFIQGIHVAASQHDSYAPTTVLQAGNVLIRNNTVHVVLPSSATRERHGIFVGNCASLVIEENRLTAQQSNTAAPQRIEGIRVWGAIGRRMFIRGNHLSGFTIGVRFWPTNLPNNANPSAIKLLWYISENLFEGATTPVQIEPRPKQTPIPGNVATFVRDLSTNVS